MCLLLPGERGGGRRYLVCLHRNASAVISGGLVDLQRNRKLVITKDIPAAGSCALCRRSPNGTKTTTRKINAVSPYQLKAADRAGCW